MLGNLFGLLASGEVRGDQEIDLRRYLGELKTPAEEEAARKQQERWQAQWATIQQEWAQQRAQAQAARRVLSPARESLLASLTLADGTSDSALWQLQETVAKATGMHVVSDCFWPPPSMFWFGQQQRAPQSKNALEALTVACAGGFVGFGFGGPPPASGGARPAGAVPSRTASIRSGASSVRRIAEQGFPPGGRGRHCPG